MDNYFAREEHECKCGCGLYNMDKTHMLMLNQARELARIPFIVTSGSRCEKHNMDGGGKDDSEHLFGYGSDLKAANSSDRFIILRAALVVGFSRIGIGKDFLHLGSMPSKQRKLCWLY